MRQLALGGLTSLAVIAVGLSGCASNPSGLQSGVQIGKPSSAIPPAPPGLCEPIEIAGGDNWNDRYPEYGEFSWKSAAELGQDERGMRSDHDDGIPPRGDCIHEVDDISAIYLDVDDSAAEARLWLAADLETGRMFTEEYSSEAWKEKRANDEEASWGTDASFEELSLETLPDAALVELKNIMEEFEVNTWPFTECPTESVPSANSYCVDRFYGYSAALLFKDGTANYRYCYSDVRSVSLRREVTKFLTQYSPDAYEVMTGQRG